MPNTPNTHATVLTGNNAKKQEKKNYFERRAWEATQPKLNWKNWRGTILNTKNGGTRRKKRSRQSRRTRRSH